MPTRHQRLLHESQPVHRKRTWFLLAGTIVLLLVAVGLWQVINNKAVSAEAPEADTVLDAQSNMPFQILIPAYLPPEFNRKKAELHIDATGPGGEPMVQLTYRSRSGATLFVREWLPINPDLEVLARSKPVETKWGKGWMLDPTSKMMLALWVDVGPLRCSIYTPDYGALSKEQLIGIGNNMGPASNRQVFSYLVEKPVVKEASSAPPVEAMTNAEGVQEVTLVITPGGYAPLRFAVRKGIPVRVIFRELGEVGCGKTLVMVTGPDSSITVSLTSENDKKTVEFTPQQTGEFTFHCVEDMFRGMMVVKE